MSTLKERLLERAKDFGVELLAQHVINAPNFDIWSGSSQPHQHHYGKHGLITHTAEVIDLCLHTNDDLGVGLDKRKIFLAALYHDYGKLFDYKPVEGTDYAEWTSTPHKKLVYHLSRSGLFWQSMSDFYIESVYCLDWLDEEFQLDVLHAILAHHGQKEWGSPVTPQTKLAWLLHLCDGISARMNDVDKPKPAGYK